jgi:hypothetical protein
VVHTNRYIRVDPHLVLSLVPGPRPSSLQKQRAGRIMAASVDEHVDTLISDDTTIPTTTTSTPISSTIVAVAPFDPTVLTDYLAELASVILNASREDLQLSLLSYSDTLQKCSKFATDPSNLVLYLRKEFGDATSQNNNG